MVKFTKIRLEPKEAFLRPVQISTDSGKRITHYAVISACCLLVGIGFLALMIWKIDAVVRLGLTGRLFYLLLIPMALASAGFLFGVLQSVATYRGRKFGGNVVMGGPIIAAALTVWGGFALPASDSNYFAATIFVHGPKGPQDTILSGQGQVVLDLPGQRRLGDIDAKGTAVFPGLAGELRGHPVPISVVAPGFEFADNGVVNLAETVYISVRKTTGTIEGLVEDDHGTGIEGAIVDVEGLVTTTKADGRFQIDVPGERVRPEMNLRVSAKGFEHQEHRVPVSGSEIQVRLVKVLPQ